MEFTKLKRVRKVQVQIADEVISFEYVPGYWDNRFVEAHNELLDEETGESGLKKSRKRIVFTLTSLLEGWDITDNGEPLAISEENLAMFDDIVLFLMYKAIRDDIEAREQAKN